MTMLTTLLQSLIFLIGSSTAANVPVSLTANNSPLNASITLPDVPVIDPRFQVTTRYLETILDVDAYLMNCLGVFGDITLDDAEAQIIPRTYPEYVVPGVSIATFPTTTGGTIEARFVVWGLYWASSRAMMNDIYQSAEYTLKWENVVVGYLDITRPEARLSLPGSSTNASLTQRSHGLSHPSRGLSRPGVSGNITLTNSPQIAIDVIPQSVPLTMLQIFASCFAGFVVIARFSKDQEVNPFDVQPGPRYGTTFGMSGEGPGFRNPDFKYEHVNAAIVFLARHLYERRVFREVRVVVSQEVSPGVDVGIGFGYIWQRGPSA
ncbi:hypothetical protein BDR22DRAFT_888542 [Usnea florida]